MNKTKTNKVLIALILLVATGCGSYRKTSLFQSVNSHNQPDSSQLQQKMPQASPRYLIRQNDLLNVRVYTNKGESILDPNGELKFGAPGGLNGVTSTGTGSVGFTVQPDGRVRLPLLEYVRVAGYTTLQLDSILEKRYSTFYKDAFVFTQVLNRRVILLGATSGKIIPLANEGMNLIEVLALGGLAQGATNRVRLVRGDLKHPQVQQIDLSTIEGLRAANIQIAANDIVYVEQSRSFVDLLREVLPFLSLITAVATLVSLARSLTR